MVGGVPSDKTCEFVFEVKSRVACWLNHTTTIPASTIHPSTNNGSTNTSVTFSPTLCSITDPAFTSTVSFKSLNKEAGLSPPDYEYKVRLCGPLPTDMCGSDSRICVGNHRIVYAEHYITALSSTSVGFYFPWGPKCSMEQKNRTAFVVVHCGGTSTGSSLSYTHYYQDMREHRFSLATPLMCASVTLQPL